MKLVRAYFKMGNVFSVWFKMFCPVLPTPAFRTAMTMLYERTPVWPSPQDMRLQFCSPHRLPPPLASPSAALHPWALQHLPSPTHPHGLSGAWQDLF